MMDEHCSQREDEQHCNCWYDGDACCACHAPEMPEDEKIAQGMVEGPQRA